MKAGKIKWMVFFGFLITLCTMTVFSADSWAHDLSYPAEIPVDIQDDGLAVTEKEETGKDSKSASFESMGWKEDEKQTENPATSWTEEPTSSEEAIIDESVDAGERFDETSTEIEQDTIPVLDGLEDESEKTGETEDSEQNENSGDGWTDEILFPQEEFSEESTSDGNETTETEIEMDQDESPVFDEPESSYDQGGADIEAIPDAIVDPVEEGIDQPGMADPEISESNAENTEETSEETYEKKADEMMNQVDTTEKLPQYENIEVVNQENIDQDREGECGENTATVYWILSDEGILTIYGNGRMKDYSVPEEAPWSYFADTIKTIEVEDGISTIGNHAFSSLKQLTDIHIASTVKEIGKNAFLECIGLKEVMIGSMIGN